MTRQRSALALGGILKSRLHLHPPALMVETISCCGAHRRQRDPRSNRILADISLYAPQSSTSRPGPTDRHAPASRAVILVIAASSGATCDRGLGKIRVLLYPNSALVGLTD